MSLALNEHWQRAASLALPSPLAQAAEHLRHVIAALETAHDQAAENDRREIASDLREMRLTLHWWVNVRNVEAR